MANQLQELSELSQQEVFTILMCHPVYSYHHHAPVSEGVSTEPRKLPEGLDEPAAGGGRDTVLHQGPRHQGGNSIHIFGMTPNLCCSAIPQIFLAQSQAQNLAQVMFGVLRHV